jgi:fumarate reductase subunit C
MSNSKLVDVSKTSVQNFLSFMRKVVNYVFLLLVLAAGFFVGKTYVELKPEEKDPLTT